jgi:FAD/FMN-containing dehydrogenase
MRTFNPHGGRNIETRRDFIKRSASAGAGFAISRAWARSGIAATPDLDPAVVKKFGATLNGQLVLPGDPSYDTVRHIAYWNSKTAKHPGVIARCANAKDVMRSVEFAREYDLLVAVRSGGHSTLGWGLCEGGLVIDVSQMKQIKIDPVKLTAQTGPGLMVREVSASAGKYGLAPALGACDTVGISGLTLGGGLVDLSGRYGASCDNLLSAEVVTADGKTVSASATQNPDLFWAIRGGGGNFGVATSLEHRLYRVAELLHGGITYRFSDARNVLRSFRDFMAEAPDELEADVILTGLSDQSVIVKVSYSGDLAKGEKVIHPLRTLAKPVSDTVHRSAYAEITPEDENEQPGFAFGKYCYIERLSDAAMEATLAQFANQSDVSCGMGLYHYMHGAICRVAGDATAFELRAPGALHIAIASSWHDSKLADASIAWVNGAWESLNGFSGGRIYANYLSVEGEDAVKAAYGKNYPKLVDIKSKYDPTNFFKLNPNIRARPS